MWSIGQCACSTLFIVVHDSIWLLRSFSVNVSNWHLHVKTSMSFSPWSVSICFLNLLLSIVFLHISQVHVQCILLCCKEKKLINSSTLKFSPEFNAKIKYQVFSKYMQEKKIFFSLLSRPDLLFFNWVKIPKVAWGKKSAMFCYL